MIRNGVNKDTRLRINIDLAVIEFVTKDEIYVVQFLHGIKLVFCYFTVEHDSSLV